MLTKYKPKNQIFIKQQYDELNGQTFFFVFLLIFSVSLKLLFSFFNKKGNFDSQESIIGS